MLQPWLYRATVNICHDLRRKRRKLVALELAGNVATRQAGPVETLEAAERAALLESALLSLGERERTAIVLRDLEGLLDDRGRGDFGQRRIDRPDPDCLRPVEAEALG